MSRSAPIGRAQVSFGAIWASESAFMVALGIVAFDAGGVGAVGIVTAARMAAAAFLAPWLATVADRVRRERVLTCVGLVRAVALGGIALVTAAAGPIAAIYGLAVVATVAQALFRPAHSALLPALCTSPRQLTRANAVRGLLDSLATLGGPAAAAILLAVSGPAAVFAACAAASLLGGLVVVGLSYDAPPRPQAAGRGGHEILEGFATIAADRGLALITSLGFVQTFTRGCLSVFIVVVAIELLDTGTPASASSRRPSAPAGCWGRSSPSGWSGAAGSRSGSASGSPCSGRRWSSWAPSPSRRWRSCCSASSASGTP